MRLSHPEVIILQFHLYYAMLWCHHMLALNLCYGHVTDLVVCYGMLKIIHLESLTHPSEGNELIVLYCMLSHVSLQVIAVSLTSMSATTILAWTEETVPTITAVTFATVPSVMTVPIVRMPTAVITNVKTEVHAKYKPISGTVIAQNLLKVSRFCLP